MIQNTNEYIQTLLDRYLAGETSSCEEHALRSYFTNADSSIPEEWLVYKALFRFVEEERHLCNSAEQENASKEAEKANVEAAKASKKAASTAPVKLRPLSHLMVYVTSAAAAALLLFSLVTPQPSWSKDCAVIDGKRYTDKNIITDEALEALNMVSTPEEDPFEALNMIYD